MAMRTENSVPVRQLLHKLRSLITKVRTAGKSLETTIKMSNKVGTPFKEESRRASGVTSVSFPADCETGVPKNLRVALVHDYLREYGGAERVLEVLHEMFPQAPVFVAFTDPQAMGGQWSKFVGWDIRTTWASRVPGIRKLFSPLRVFAERFFTQLDLSGYDLVISSTNMYMAKAARAVKPAVHITYCHTPPRALYGYTTMTDWKKNPIIRIGGELLNHYLRIVDWRTAQNPDVFIANSKEVQARIKKFYRRESVVVYPPICVPEKLPVAQPAGFCLIVGRLAWSKHFDVVVKACAELNQELVVVGTGKLQPYLRSLAGAQTRFLGSVSDTELDQLYVQAKVAIYPAEDEDFGMIPVEAMAHGTPVIAHRSGGSKETVIEGKTGLFVDTFEVEEMKHVIVQALNTHWSREQIFHHAQKFRVARFQREMLEVIRTALHL